MVTGYNICPICNKKYSPKNESKIKMGNNPICLNCYRKHEQISKANKVKKCPNYVQDNILSDIKNFLYEKSDFDISYIEHLEMRDLNE